MEQPAHVGPGPDGPVHPARPGGQDRLAQAHHHLAEPVHDRNQGTRQAGRRRLHEKAPAQQDQILATPSVGEFTSLLFEHTIEGLYASPEYGGNKNLAGWKEIGFPGDIQPRGYSATEVERSDGHDPVDSTGIVADVLKLLGAL